MDIVKLYNKRSNPNDELEVLISDNKDVCFSLIGILKDYTVNKYIDLWAGKHRLRSELGGENKIIFKELIKSERIQMHNLVINLKEEKPVNTFDKNSIDLVRCKFQYRYIIDVDHTKWALDIARIASVKGIQNVKQFKVYLEKANKFDDTELKVFDTFSVELECLERSIEYETLTKALKTIMIHLDNRLAGYDALEHLAGIHYQCTGRKGSMDYKGLLNNVVGVDINNYKSIYDNMTKYMVCEKTDGDRCCLTMLNGSAYLLSDSITRIFKCGCDKVVLLDGELCKQVFNVFDCIQYGDVVCHEPFTKRYEIAKECLEWLTPILEKCSIDFSVRLKPMYQCSSTSIKEVFEAKYDCPIDGLIFTKSEGAYYDSPLKWKPIENITIDFLVIRTSRPLKSMVKHDNVMYYLYTTIKKEDYDKTAIFDGEKVEHLNIKIKDPRKFPVLFMTTRDPKLYIYNTKDPAIQKLLEQPCIGEFRQQVVNGELKGWELVRIRKDRQSLLDEGKYFGNNYFVAEKIMEQYYNPLTINDLVSFKGKRHYFMVEKSNIYRAANGVNSAIKADIYKYGHGNHVEVGAGKGQDLARIKERFEEALVIDVDNAALSELVSRVATTEGKVKLYVLHADFMNMRKSQLDLLAKETGVKSFFNWANMVSINFAIHYLLKKVSSIYQLYNIVNALLLEGYFTFTCLNGAKVLRKLQENNASTLNYFEDGLLKYSIKHINKDPEITLNTIEVLLPFSAGEYYLENLVDVDKIISVFVDKGYKLIESSGFDKYLFNPSFKTSEVDKEYGKFNHYVVLLKEPK